MSREAAAVYFAKYITKRMETEEEIEISLLYEDIEWAALVQRLMGPGLRMRIPNLSLPGTVVRVSDTSELAVAVVQMTSYRWRQYRPHSLEWPLGALDVLDAERVANDDVFSEMGMRASVVQNPESRQCLIQVDPAPTTPLE